MAQMSQQQQVLQGIAMYKANPSEFSTEDIQMLQAMAAEQGIPFSPNTNLGRAAGRFAFNLADSALFGLLPDSMAPAALTPTEEFAGTVGDIAGIFTTPLAVGAKAGKWSVGAIKKMAETGKLSTAFQGTKLAEKFPKMADKLGKAGDKFVSKKKVNEMFKAWAEDANKLATIQKMVTGGVAAGSSNIMDGIPFVPDLPRVGMGALGGYAGARYGMRTPKGAVPLNTQ